MIIVCRALLPTAAEYKPFSNVYEMFIKVDLRLGHRKTLHIQKDRTIPSMFSDHDRITLVHYE